MKKPKKDIKVVLMDKKGAIIDEIPAISLTEAKLMAFLYRANGEKASVMVNDVRLSSLSPYPRGHRYGRNYKTKKEK